MSNHSNIKPRRRLWRRLYFALTLAIVFSLGAFEGTALADPTPGLTPASPTKVNGDAVKVGQVVATGKPRPRGTYEFGAPMEVTTTAPGQGKTRWVGIHIDSRCRAVVSAAWDGSLAQGPSHVVGPLQALLPKASSPVAEQQTQPSSASASASAAQPAVLLASKTSEQHVYMYGFGGPGDNLTHKWGTLTFSWDGANAWINSQSGSCQGSDLGMGWRWLVDGCWTTSTNIGPAWQVWRNGQGDYHCDPPGNFPCNGSNPDGYYHSLYDYENGYGNGASTCTFGSSGNIVYGTGRDILQGCS